MGLLLISLLELLHMKTYTRTALFLLSGFSLHTALVADDAAPAPHSIFHHQPTEMPPLPWLTGPLLTPSGHVVPTGHWNFEPYLYVTTDFGVYDKNWSPQSIPNFYNILSSSSFQYGLPGPLDISFTPQFQWNHTDGASQWEIADMPIGIDVQLWQDNTRAWRPAIKLQLKANLPFGKYQNLNPNKLGTDVSGSGSFLPGIGLVSSRLFHFKGHHFLATRFNVSYTFPTPVHVKNYNAYGGGHHTHGTVFPGQSITALAGFEYTLTQNWVLALDIQYLHTNKNRFKGHAGSSHGVANVVTSPSSEQLSFAPAVEYNWTTNVGAIAGCWFTALGRNSTQFASGVIAINIYL